MKFKFLFILFAFMFFSDSAQCCNASMAGPFVKIGKFAKETGNLVKNMASSLASNLSGFAKNPIKLITDILIKIPSEIGHLEKELAESRELVNKTLIIYRKINSVEELKQTDSNLNDKINNIMKYLKDLSKNPTIKQLEMANFFCSSPQIMIVISLPAGAGQSVASLCGALATESTRIEGYLETGESALNDIMSMKEKLNEHMNELPNTAS
jgi:hypothetical protein